MKRVWLIDASIYFFKAYFGPAPNSLATFARTMLRLRRDVDEDLALVAWDHSLFTGFRHQLCDHYKANRALPDEQLADELATAERLCKALGFADYASEIYEADDILATAARWAREKGLPITVISADKDLGQLILAEQDLMWDYPNGDKLGMSEIKQYFGVPAHMIADKLALAGDAADNIQGIPGVGIKTATQLIDYLGGVEQILARRGEIEDLPIRGAKRVASLIDEYDEAVLIAKALTTLADDIDMPLDESVLSVRQSDVGELAALEAIIQLSLITKALK